MDEWTLSEAQAFVHLYHRTEHTIDKEPFYVEDPRYACCLSSYDLLYALQHQAKRMMESSAYAATARTTAMTHLVTVDPRVARLAQRSTTILRDVASCVQERFTGRVARHRLAALLWPRAKRFAALRKLRKLYKAHVETAIDILDTLLFVEDIAQGDP